jgi:hypothetical protein
MLGNKIIIFVMNFPLTTLFLFIVLLSSCAFAQKTNPDLQSTNVPTADEVDEALSNLKSFRNLHKYAGVSTKERVVLRNNFLPQVKNLQKKSPDRYGRTGKYPDQELMSKSLRYSQFTESKRGRNYKKSYSNGSDLETDFCYLHQQNCRNINRL